MKQNMGKIDRGARLVAAIALLFLAFGTGFASTGVLHWLCIGAAAIFVLTSLVGSCPLYTIFGIKTCRT